ncbi:hypothetical protein Taro_017680 [Colocasia esculenta]|uniref:Uncharacterized protein n=1 Tax=Colocasia esculenta TaxID=4460 RepID=A0A843URS6_COLES|nr:hypothetical protein [Colocasia esculenta]
MEYSCKVWCKPCRRRLIFRLHSRHSWRPRLKYQLRTMVDLPSWRDSRKSRCMVGFIAAYLESAGSAEVATTRSRIAPDFSREFSVERQPQQR